MEGHEIEASKREATGKKVRFLRRQGLIPANIYGRGIDSTALQVDTKSLKQILAHAGKTDLISLKVDDSKNPVKVLLLDVQRNPLNDELLHVEFYQVKMTEKIKVDVPLEFIGEAPALKRKNVALLRVLDALQARGLLLRVAHHGDPHVGEPHVFRHADAGHRDERHARIVDLLDDGFGHDLPDQVGDPEGPPALAAAMRSHRFTCQTSHRGDRGDRRESHLRVNSNGRSNNPERKADRVS
jgi:ribosomal protein bL25 (Ctc-form)